MTARLSPLALAAAAIAVSSSGAAAAVPPGVIHELPRPTRVDEISAGPHGELWFATTPRQKAVGWIGGDERVHRFDLPPHETAERLVAAGGGAWFSYYRYRGPLAGGESGIAHVSRDGRVTNFQGYPDPGLIPDHLAVGREGDVWFDGGGPLTGGEDWIGRMTPTGEYTMSPAGQPVGARIVSVSVDGDDVWFADGDNYTIGRRTPGGQLTQFAAARSDLRPWVDPPVFGADGSAWFIGKEGSQGKGPGVYWVAKLAPGSSVAQRFGLGLSPKVTQIGSPAVAPDGSVWFGVERKAKPGTTASPDGPAALGRLAPGGRITEFSRRLRPAERPEDLTVGPEGDVWFVGGTPRSHDYLRSSLGRVNAAGKIVEFRDGLPRESVLEELTASAGRLWFIDGLGGRIGELRPPAGTPNTFSVEFTDRRHRGTEVEVTVPGPGKVEIEETGVVTQGRVRPVAGLRSRAVRAGACGPVSIPLPFSPPLQRLLERRGSFRLRMTVTFTPRGGAPFSQPAGIALVPG